MLIIFDCDGVLVDSEPIAARVLERYLRELDYPLIVRAEDHDRFLGYTLAKMVAELESATGVPLPANFIDELRRRDQAAFTTELRPIDGITAALARLPQARCIASSGPYEKIRRSLALTGRTDLFEPHIFSAHDPNVARGKPAPDLFRHAAGTMGFAPGDCLVIEDSVAGVEAGVAAGMRVFGFSGGGHCRSGHDETLRVAGAMTVFSDMEALPALVAHR